MFLQRFTLKTPTLRFKKLPIFIDQNYNYLAKRTYNKKIFIKKLQNGHSFSRRLQLYSPNTIQSLTYHEKFIFSTIIIGFDFLKPFYKELVLLKDFYNRFFYKPALNLYYPGFIFQNFKVQEYQTLISFFLGNYLSLKFIPYYVNFSHIFNKNEKTPNFVKSVGAFAYKKRDPLRSKLMYVILPSGQWKYFTGLKQCYLGFIESYKKDDFFFGSWGQLFRYKKKITVRGVAKNAVDHPNGGRTKTKQPERSPWGWVAKHNK